MSASPSPQPPQRTRLRLSPSPRRALLKRLGVALTLSLVALSGWVLLVPFPTDRLAPHHVTSTRVLDRDGHQLREVLNHKDGRGRWLALDEISPHLAAATIHTEDKRFHNHGGVDLIAIARAATLNAQQRRVVSGASTITQQTVKMTLPRSPRRDLRAKLQEAVWAIRLERALSKEDILAQYLNRAPYGNQLFGAEAAAQAYFGKPAADLSLAEAALLAGIPQAPSVTEPLRHRQRAVARQRVVLQTMRQRDAISEEDYRRALAEPLLLRSKRAQILAPHFTDHALRLIKKTGEPLPQEIHTTLDLALQEKVEGVVSSQLHTLRERGVGQLAVVVLNTRSGEVLAWVGSRDYWDADHEGANDGVIALRQPGSTLKPFVYGLYLERGGTAADPFMDLPTHFPTEQGVYIPKNYDQDHRGPVSLRDALGSSLNIPAVAATAEIGEDALLKRLRQAGLQSLTEDAGHYGLGLALGNGEIQLLELAGAYAALGRLGRWRPTRLFKDGHDAAALLKDQGSPNQPSTLFSPAVSYTLLDILSDDLARAQGFGRHGPLALPYRVAAKTGTSTDFRDNWAVGVTPDYTVAVWAGNFDGAPMEHVTGVTGAAPTLRQVFQALYPQAASHADVAWFPQPRSLTRRHVCAHSGQPAGPACTSTRIALLPDGYQGASRINAHGRGPGAEHCELHVHVAIDTRNGLRAGPDCDPAFVQHQTFHRLSPEWMEWGLEHGLTPAPEADSPLCPAGPASAPDAEARHQHTRIIHPTPGDTFVIDHLVPREAQSITLRAHSPEDALTWFIDGVPLREVSPPHTTTWTPTPGHHVIGLGHDSPVTTITIEVQ